MPCPRRHVGLPHAQTHTVVLPYVLAFNAPAVPEAAAAVCRALGAGDAPTVLQARRLGAPRSLAELGLGEGGLAAAAEQVAGQAYAYPRPVTADDARDVLRAAYEGRAVQARG